MTDPTPTLNLTFQQLQLPALVLESGTTVNGTCTLLGVPQCELFGAFSIVQVAANGALLEGEERNRPIENGVPEVIPVFSPGVAFCRAVVDDQNITSQMILFTSKWMRKMEEKIEPLTIHTPDAGTVYVVQLCEALR